MQTRTAKILGIGEAYRKADEEVLNHGNVTKSTRDTIEQALNAEIAAVERQLDAWNSSGEMTQVQERNFFALAETLGTLKAKLDILPAEYTLDMEAETQRANADIDELKLKAELKDIVVPVDADTSNAENKIDDIVADGEVIIDVDADTSNAEDKIADLGKPIKSELTVTANTGKVQKDVNKLKTPTKSTHNIKDNASKVQSAINALKKTTSSTHIIYIKKIVGHSTGGLIKQHLAGGGTFTGSGRVPGYDASDSDRVNARLTAGEFVFKRSSVDSIGVATLNAMNAKGKTPTGATSSVAGGMIPMPDTVVNLSIGGKAFKMMTDRQIAEALQRYMKYEGGA